MSTNTHSIDLESTSSQYLSITDAAQTGLDITGDMTLECWVNFESVGTQILLSKYDGTTNRSWNFLYNGTSLVFYNSSDGANVSSDSSVWSPDLATWYQIAIAYDASAGTAELYINGSSVDTLTGLATSMFNSSAPFLIGSFLNTTSNPDAFWDGKIDDVRVWSDIRTPTEISNNYNKELVGNEANLVAYWKLNNSLLDETSNNNDLTNNNSAVFSTDVPFTGVTNTGFFQFM